MNCLIKRTGIIMLAVACVICVMPAQGKAGTFIVGAKTWTAMWDSWMGQQIEHQSAGSEADMGIGIMAGPVLGYQTDDSTWSFGAALMALSYFKQDIKDMGETIEADARRMDFDFAVNYTFLTYFKAFAGYKLQYYTIDFDMNAGTLKMKMWSHIPTVGLAAVYPLTESLIAGIQAGFLYGILGDLEGEMGGTNFEPVKMKNGLGFNTEINLSYLVTEQVMVQGGFRYQQMDFKPKSTPSYTNTDRFFGITLGAVYMI